MTVFGAGPTREADGSAALWLAFAGGVLALVHRVLFPVVPQSIAKPDQTASATEFEPGPTLAHSHVRHEHDLTSRNLNARLG